MNDQGQDGDAIVDERVDFVMPEGTSGQNANFSARTQQEAFLGGASKASSSAEEAPKTPTPESEWPMGVRKSIEVNGRKWEYLEYGNPDGRTVLNVHGWLGASAKGNERLSLALAGKVQDSRGMQTLDQDLPKGAQKIREITEGLTGKYHIITPELPGFGKSDALNNPTIDAMADELVAFQKSLGQERSVVFGSSAGAILATKMAVRHPEAVGALVLQGMMTKPEDMQKAAYIAARIATFPPIKVVLERLPATARQQIFKSMVSGSKDFKNADLDTQNLLVESAKEAEAHTALQTLSEIGENIEWEVERVQAPTVVLDGAAGDLVPIKTVKKIAGRYHPEAGNTLGEKVRARQVVYFQVGGIAGEHTHDVINTFPEEVAVLINHAVDNYFPKENLEAVKGALPEDRVSSSRGEERSRLARVRSRLATLYSVLR